jgi:alkylhydroperoxidase/carboxymuconolactone decarboxylase family protein YurZ
MRRIILVNGAIAGLIMVAMLIVSLILMDKGIINFSNGEIVGYSSMIVALSMIFFGVKSYRDKHLNGVITFWKGLQVGLLVTAVASVIYAAGWEVYYNGVPGVKETFMDKYIEFCVNKKKHEGATQEEIDKTLADLTSMKEIYTNPFIRFGMTMTEVLPVGIIIAVVSAGVLRKRELLP